MLDFFFLISLLSLSSFSHLENSTSVFLGLLLSNNSSNETGVG